MPIEIQSISGDRVRVPNQRPGAATVISRYSKERAVVMHPSDFHRLQALDDLLSRASATEELDFSAAAIAAHQAADTPSSSPITDPQQLAELFD